MERKVSYYETDKMQIVHHSNYIRYMEEARLDWLETHGLNYQELENNGIMLPVVSVNARYEKPLKFGDIFQVCTKLTQLTNVKITLSYIIKNAVTEDICCVGESVHCFVNNDFKPIALKKTNPQVYELFQNALNNNL